MSDTEKYLRYILSNEDEAAVAAVLGDNAAGLAWTYEHYARCSPGKET